LPNSFLIDYRTVQENSNHSPLRVDGAVCLEDFNSLIKYHEASERNGVTAPWSGPGCATSVLNAGPSRDIPSNLNAKDWPDTSYLLVDDLEFKNVNFEFASSNDHPPGGSGIWTKPDMLPDDQNQPDHFRFFLDTDGLKVGDLTYFDGDGGSAFRIQQQDAAVVPIVAKDFWITFQETHAPIVDGQGWSLDAVNFCDSQPALTAWILDPTVTNNMIEVPDELAPITTPLCAVANG
jgi:hypothetical protein